MKGKKQCDRSSDLIPVGQWFLEIAYAYTFPELTKKTAWRRAGRRRRGKP